MAKRKSTTKRIDPKPAAGNPAWFTEIPFRPIALGMGIGAMLSVALLQLASYFIFMFGVFVGVAAALVGKYRLESRRKE